MKAQKTGDSNPWREKYLAAHPGRASEQQRRYSESHPGRRAEIDKRWAAAHPEAVRTRNARRVWPGSTSETRARLRFRNYGVTADWFRDQLVGQAGRCAICGSVFKSERDTHIDHDHSTKRVRGLLCNGCNLVLGHAKDSQVILTNAIRYLGV